METTVEYQAGSGKQIADQESQLAEYSGPDRVVSSRDWWGLERDRPRPEISYRYCMPRLDALTEGVETGELVVVSGPAKHGKTTLCDTIGRNFSKQGARILWFSFEMMPRKFLEKYDKPEAPIIYVPMELKSGDLHWLQKRVFEAKVKYGCRVVFIDHLHFIVDMARMRNPSLEIGAVMRFLKREIAVKFNMVVVLVSHLTKLKFEEEPSENDLRDSSFIAQESDAVIMVYRRLDHGKNLSDDNPYSNRARAVVCLHRRKGTMKARVGLVKIGDDMVEEAEDECPL